VAQQPDARVVRHLRPVGRPVVDDDALEVGQVLRQQAPQRPGQERGLLVHGHEDRDARGHRRWTST
jgi:hypothetical protein